MQEGWGVRSRWHWLGSAGLWPWVLREGPKRSSGPCAGSLRLWVQTLRLMRTHGQRSSRSFPHKAQKLPLQSHQGSDNLSITFSSSFALWSYVKFDIYGQHWHKWGRTLKSGKLELRKTQGSGCGRVYPQRGHQRPGMCARQARSTPNAGIRGRACLRGRHGLPRMLASEAGHARTAGRASLTHTLEVSCWAIPTDRNLQEWGLGGRAEASAI